MSDTSLTQEELEALKSLAKLAPVIVRNLTESAGSAIAELPKQTKKRGRPRKTEQPAINIPKVENSVSDVDDDEEDAGDSPRRTRRPPKKRGKGKVACRREPIQTPTKRVNLFDKMMESKGHKEDSAIDKKLWKGKKLSPRGTRTTLVAAECNECGGSFNVSPHEIKKDYDGNIEYICNECLVQKRDE